MGLAFLHPRWLWWAAICAPLVWMVVAASRSRGNGGPRLAHAIIRTIVVVGIVAAAAGPLRIAEVHGVSAIALLDVSASITDRDLAREQRVLEDLSRAAVSPHELKTIRFASVPMGIEDLPVRSREAATTRAPVVARAPRALAMGTDIASALGLAAGWADPSRDRRVVLVSDGRATAGDALAQAGRVAAMGIRVDEITLGSTSDAADVAVDELFAPPDIQPRAAFPLRVRLAANVPSRVRVTVARDGAPFGDVRMETIAAGETMMSWDARVDRPGTAVFTATVRRQEARPATATVAPGGGDAHPENDRALLAVSTTQPPRVLVLAGAAADAAPLVAALHAQAIDAVMVAASASVSASASASGRIGDGAVDAAGLAQADLIVLCDLPRAALSERVLADIETHVRDGAGLLVTGGPHAFGPGDWSGSRLEPLLPLRLESPEKREEPALALALVIDRSGSMSGAKLELTKRAARATADMLPPDDQIAVVAFDREATTIVPLQRAANRMRIGTDIARIQATGGTNIQAGLREALDQLMVARAKKKHAILLSDGQSNPEGIVELVDAAVAAHITISAVGVGDGVDDGLLQLIAGNGGGRYYHTRDPASIPRIFTRETSQVAVSGIVERSTTVVPRKRASMLTGLTIELAPRLEGYVRTHTRADAELLLATDTGEPVLARWALGLGQVVAWTSDLGPRWANRWARWPPFSKFWGQIARGTMRARASRVFPMTVELAGAGQIRIVVEAVGSDDRFLSGMEAALEVTELMPEEEDWSGGPAGTSKAGRIRGGPATATATVTGSEKTAGSAPGGGLVPPTANAARDERWKLRGGPPVPVVETEPGRYEATFETGAGVGGRVPAALLLRASFSLEGHPIGVARGHVSLPPAVELRPLPAIAPMTSAAHAPLTGGELLAAIAARTGGGALASGADVFRDASPRRAQRSLRVPLLLFLAVLYIFDVALRRVGANRRGRVPTA